MKLSAAILLGSTVMTPSPGGMIHDDGSGCALGMALKATGRPLYVDTVSGLPRTIAFLRNRATSRTAWPWLSQDFPVPCSCSRAPCSDGFKIVTHLFDDHVFGRADWTLEQLVDWVQSVEHEEETEPQRSPAMAMPVPAKRGATR